MTRRSVSSGCTCYRRRGTTYLLVMGTTMLVTTISLAALSMVRVERRGIQGSMDAGAASCYALSAIEKGFLTIRDDPAWQTNLGTGAWFSDAPIGDGTFSLTVTVVDASRAILTGQGNSGDARHQAQVTITEDRGGWVVSPGSWKQTVN